MRMLAAFSASSARVAWSCLVLSLVFSATALAATVKVEPRETDELLANPGMGWQTFHQFADNDRNLQGLPSSSAYFRFYWREIEPAEGQIDFAKLDELFAHAGRSGQKIALRIMCTGSGEYGDVPTWLKDKGCKGVEFTYGNRKHWVPDFTDPVFKEAHSRLINSLGQRYDRHPQMDLLDIGSVGLWGEWHMSSTDMGGGKEVPLPPVERGLEIIREWCEAFPQSSKVILIGSDEGMQQAAKQGYGWRADCLGDMGGFSKNWNHMEKYYLQQIAKTGATDAWTNAPVAFESCWDMRKWKESGWDIRFIFDYALKCHASYVNNKSAPIPAGTRDEVERLLRRLGYRLVIRSVEHAEEVRPGDTLRVALTGENVGVAPPYRDFRVAVRLRSVQPDTSSARTEGESIRGWLPGLKNMNLPVTVPSDAKPRMYEVAFAILDPQTKEPAVRLANEGRDATGWYPFSRVRVR